MTELPIYVLERDFDAPPETVWRTWTEPDLFARWYGPNIETVIHEMSVAPGERCILEMRWGENGHYQRLTYTEVEPPSRLVWLHSNSDAEGNVIANPMMPNWPRELETIVTFESAGGGTRLRLTWTPHEASPEEIAAFAAAVEGMGKGWGAGMEILAEVVAELAD